jgi:F420H(2)-dependent quinone reductase
MASLAAQRSRHWGDTMDEDIRRALSEDRTIDITTLGRKSNRPHRIETWLFRADGKHFLTGSPGRRDWYANLLHTPDLTLHLKQRVKADLPARATPITDPEERKAIFTRILGELDALPDLETWLAGSPLMELQFNGESNDTP